MFKVTYLHRGFGSTQMCSAIVSTAAVIVKGQPYTADSSYSSAPPSDLELDWSDFFFNMVSMAIVYVYFSKTAVTGENLVAILLCMGVAAFDILLLAMRWLWFEQYLNHG